MEIFDVFDLTNVINEPTCFPAINNPSLLDIIFTNMPKKCQNILNFNCGISDCHNMIGFTLDLIVPKPLDRWIKYRSFKSFNEEEFFIRSEFCRF
jgi:hypothetical protein